MDDANQRLESSTKPIYNPVRRSYAERLTETPFTQNSGHPPGQGFHCYSSHRNLGSPLHFAL